MAPQFQNRGVSAVRGLANTDLPDITVTGRRYLDFDTCHRFNVADGSGDCLRNDRFAGAGDPFSGDYGRGGKERLTLGGLMLNSSWASGPWTFTSVSGLDYNDREVVVDFDALAVRPGRCLHHGQRLAIRRGRQSSSGTTTAGLELTIGAQYFREELDGENDFWNNASARLAQQFGQKTDRRSRFRLLQVRADRGGDFRSRSARELRTQEFRAQLLIQLLSERCLPSAPRGDRRSAGAVRAGSPIGRSHHALRADRPRQVLRQVHARS